MDGNSRRPAAREHWLAMLARATNRTVQLR
jgi:hypothetical protein